MRTPQFALQGLVWAGLLASSAQAVFKLDTKQDIKDTAATLAYDLMTQYTGNRTGMIPGILPGPPTENLGDYYWWEGGAMMGTYIDYWKLTGDTSYNKVVQQGILHQVGEDRDFQPLNHTLSLGNDDQGFWGMTAMLAAENKFPDPPEGEPQWLALAQATWNTQASPERHDDECNGGMRWQVPPTNTGYNYKNTIANGCFFNIGARLARYTGNKTYAKHAEETWDWLWAVNYIDHELWRVYDGGHVEKNCTDINKATFSYNSAIMIQGVAFLYNFTESETWKNRLDNLVDRALKDFFPKGIMYEVPCEGRQGQCSTDMLSFKGYVHRWLAMSTQVAPHLADKVRPILDKSARAAAAQCTGGETGRGCGFYWSGGKYVDISVDGTSGAGEQMSVLAAVSSMLIADADPPATSKKGGTSKGDPNAGQNKKKNDHSAITTGDKAGAGFLTFVILAIASGSFYWMSASER